MPGKIAKLRAVVVAAAVLAGLAGCSGTGQTNQTVDDAMNGNTVASNAAFHYWKPGDRQTVHDVTGPTVVGGTFDLSSYRGSWVVVNFWSSTCVPCDAEAQGFQGLADQLAGQGVKFVGIDERDNLTAAQNFQRAHGVKYPSLFDEHDSFILAFAPDAVPSTTPFTIVIDPRGGIAARAATSLTYTELKEFVSRARSLST